MTRRTVSPCRVAHGWSPLVLRARQKSPILAPGFGRQSDCCDALLGKVISKGHELGYAAKDQETLVLPSIQTRKHCVSNPCGPLKQTGNKWKAMGIFKIPLAMRATTDQFTGKL